MKILVRLPNWLGDMVMATGFVRKLQEFFPGAEVWVIAKKGIHELLPFIPGISGSYIFSKDEYKGVGGPWRFGKAIAKEQKFDLFFSLPESFSSAMMGFAMGARKRIGFKKEWREVLLTNSYTRPANGHRAETYINLLEQFTGKRSESEPDVSLLNNSAQQDHIIININSEAQSRRLTVPKAVEIVKAAADQLQHRIVLISAPKEKPFVETVMAAVGKPNVESAAGTTSLPALVTLIGSARAVLTTDSGPAHLANALGRPTVVLFGAGNENHTAPYNKENRAIIRLGKLSCEPCVRNECVQFKTPQCLELLETNMIIGTIEKMLV